MFRFASLLKLSLSHCPWWLCPVPLAVPVLVVCRFFYEKNIKMVIWLDVEAVLWSELELVRWQCWQLVAGKRALRCCLVVLHRSKLVTRLQLCHPTSQLACLPPSWANIPNWLNVHCLWHPVFSLQHRWSLMSSTTVQRVELQSLLEHLSVFYPIDILCCLMSSLCIVWYTCRD